MKNPMLRAQIALSFAATALRARLDNARESNKELGDRGDSPISTVIVIVAAIVGAMLIAGGLAALYAKANGKLGNVNIGN